MGETYDMIVESRTWTVEIQHEMPLTAEDGTHASSNSSAKAQFDGDPETRTVQTESVSLRAVRTAENVSLTHVDNCQTSFADSETGEQGESLFKIAVRSFFVISAAGLYLFDFISNVLVLKLYWQQVYKQGQFEGSKPGSLGNAQKLTAFVTCLCLLLLTQFIAILTFKLKLPPEEYPFRSACLLPLVQAYRLLKELCRWRTAQEKNRRGFSKRWEASEAESLFAIMSAMETSLQIPLQTSYIALTGLGDRRWRPPPVLVLSIVASFVSGAYNAGLAIMYNTSLRRGALLNATGIAGGLYTVGSMLLRSMAITQVGVGSEVSGIHHLKLVGGYFVLSTVVFYCFGLISMGKHAKRFTLWAQVRAVLATFYLVLGPVYLVLEGCAPKVTSISLMPDILVRLLVVVIFNVLFDVFTFVIFAKLNWGICRYSKERIPLTYLTSTFKCSRYVQLTSIGAVLSLVSALSLCYFLLPSFLQGIIVSVILEIRKLTSPWPCQVSSYSMHHPYQPGSGRMIAPKGKRTNFTKFSSRITNFDGKDFQVSRMVSTNSATEQFDGSLELRDVEALTSEQMRSPKENNTTHELLRPKATYCTLTNAQSCCRNSLQSAGMNTLQKLRNGENRADLDLNVKSQMAECAPDSDVLGEIESEQASTNEGSATIRSINGGIELNHGRELQDSFNERLTKGIHEFGQCELITKRNGEFNGDEGGDADESYVAVANVEDHVFSLSKTLMDRRAKFSRSTSAGMGEKSCPKDKIVRFRSVSLGSSASFRKLERKAGFTNEHFREEKCLNTLHSKLSRSHSLLSGF